MGSFRETNGIGIKEAWWKFHRENPKVYRMYEEEVYKALSKGKEKLSSKLILNYIRWNLYLETDSKDEYKINDAFTAWYARYFLHLHPEHEGLFELRKIRSK